jgi:hypothetical protein
MSGPARVNLHIERLVLNGLPDLGDRGAALGAAVEAELARLFAAEAGGGLSQSLAVPSLRGVPVTTNAAAPAFGIEVARSIHGAVTR